MVGVPGDFTASGWFSSPSSTVSLGAYFRYHQHPAVFDQGVIDVGAIEETHIGKGAPIFVEAVGLKGHVLAIDQCGSGLLRSLAIGLPFLGAIDAAEEDAFREVAVPKWFFRSLLDCY